MPINSQPRNGDSGLSPESDLRLRVQSLEQMLLDPRSDCYLEGLLDMVTMLVEDCRNIGTSKSNKHLNSIFLRFEKAAKGIEEHRLRASDFDVIKVIGQGAFGQVQLVRHNTSKRVFALKVLDKSQMLEQSQSAFFWEEREIMANANSEWIVRLFHAFQDAKNLYMCMEFLGGGNLVNWMDMVDLVPEHDAGFYVAEVVLALEVLHGMGFVHRDVKPDNMLLDARGHLKLADFGTCIRVDPKTGVVRSDTAVGTPDYISPEVLLSQNSAGVYGREVDWWALGVFLFELLYAETPFYSESLVNTYSKIMNHTNTLTFLDDPPLSDDSIDLMKRLMSDRSERLGRNGAAEVKDHPFFQRDEWTWTDIRSRTPPYVPRLASETDTSNFDQSESGSSGVSSDPRRNRRAHADFGRSDGSQGGVKQFTAENLSFAGFTFTTSEFGLFTNRSYDNGPRLSNGEAGSEELRGMRVALTKLENQLEEALADGEMHSREADSLHQRVTQLEHLRSRLESEREVEEQTAADLRTQADQLRARLDQNKTEMARTTAERNKLEAEVNRLQSMTREEVALRDDLEKSSAEQSYRLAQLGEKCEELTVALEASRQRSQDMEKEKMKLERTWKSLEIEVAAWKQKCERATAENDQLKAKSGGRTEELDKRLQEEQTQKEQLETSLMTMEKANAELQLDVSQLRNQLDSAQQEAVQTQAASEAWSKKEMEAIKGRLREAGERATKAEREVREVKEQLEAEQYFSDLYKGQLAEIEEDTVDKSTKVERLSRELKASTTQVDQLRKEVQELTEKLKVASEEQRQAVRQQAEQSKKEIKTLEQSTASLQVRVTQLEEKLSERDSQLTIVQADLDIAQENVDRGQKDIETERLKTNAAVSKLKEIMTGDGSAAIAVMALGRKGGRNKVSGDVYRQLDRKYKLQEANTAKMEVKHKADLRELRDQLEEALSRATEAESEQQRLQDEVKMKEQEIDELVRQLTPLASRVDDTPAGKSNNASLAIPATPVRRPSGSSLSSGSGISLAPSTTQEENRIEGVLELTGKGRSRNKMLWEPRFARIADSRLIFFDKDLQQPVWDLQLYRIVYVRPVISVDVIHAKKEDIPRIFQIFFDTSPSSAGPGSTATLGRDFSVSSSSLSQSVCSASSTASPASFPAQVARKFSLVAALGGSDSGDPLALTTIVYQGHSFQRMHFRVPTFCELCHRSCSNLVNPPLSYQCQQCHFKVHGEHVTKKEKLQSCNKATKIQLVRAPSEADRNRWLQALEAAVAQAKVKAGINLIGRESIRNPQSALRGRSVTLPPNASLKDIGDLGDC